MMTMVTVSKFDAADYLKTPEAIAEYLAEAIETGDAAYLRKALDTVERATKGETFKATAHPDFDALWPVVRAFGDKLVSREATC
jgi:DNA-binding phage protein